MKKTFSLSIILLLFAASVTAHTISVLVKGYTKSVVLLVDCSADKNSIADSARTNAMGFATIKIPSYRPYGQYKLVINGNETIEILADNEDIVLETDISDVQKNLVIKQSENNKQYYSWMEQSQTIKTKLELLQQLYEAYPKDDNFAPKVQEEYDQEVANYELLCTTPFQSKPNSLVAKVIKAKRDVFAPITLSPYEREFYARRHFFDYTPFADTQLLATNALTQRSFNYIMRYTSKEYTKEQQIQIIKQGIDSLMRKLIAYPKAYEQVTDYLINGFEGMGAGILVEHIAQQYVSQNSCEGDGKKTTLERKVLSYTKLNEGADAPAFSSTDVSGKTITNANFAGKTMLLVFWASWCPHCEMMLPEIKQIYESQKIKKFEFVTASLDTNKVIWKNFIHFNHFTSGTHLCDGKSWDGQMAMNYLIYATPSVFLIKDGKIIARPGSIDDLKATLRKKMLIE